MMVNDIAEQVKNKTKLGFSEFRAQAVKRVGNPLDFPPGNIWCRMPGHEFQFGVRNSSVRENLDSNAGSIALP